MKRTTDDILAEAKADDQDAPVKEPFELVLRSGYKVTFRDPQDIPVEIADEINGSFVRQMNALIPEPKDQRKFWAEWGKVKQRYISALVDAIVKYYTGDPDTEGKERSSAS